MAWTPESASACWRSSDWRSFSGAAAAAGVPGVLGTAVPSAETTVVLRPASCDASGSSHGARLIELRAQRALVRREGEDDPVAVDVDALRLRHDRAVEELLRLADLVEKRVLQLAGGAARARSDRRATTAVNRVARAVLAG